MLKDSLKKVKVQVASAKDSSSVNDLNLVLCNEASECCQTGPMLAIKNDPPYEVI